MLGPLPFQDYPEPLVVGYQVNKLPALSGDVLLRTTTIPSLLPSIRAWSVGS